MHTGRIVREPVVQLRPRRQEIRCLKHVLAAHPVTAVLKGGFQVLLKPVIDDVEPGHSPGAPLPDKVRQLDTGYPRWVAVEDNHVVPKCAQAAAKTSHRRPVQDQLV